MKNLNLFSLSNDSYVIEVTALLHIQNLTVLLANLLRLALAIVLNAASNFDQINESPTIA